MKINHEKQPNERSEETFLTNKIGKEKRLLSFCFVSPRSTILSKRLSSIIITSKASRFMLDDVSCHQQHSDSFRRVLSDFYEGGRGNFTVVYRLDLL